MAVPKPKEQRVEVLIDVQNLYHSAKNLYHAKVNYQEILKNAIAGRKFIRAFGYVVVSFLWLAALVVFSGAVYKMAQGSVIMKGMMQPKMKTDYVPQVIRMQPAYLPGIIMPEKSPLAKDQKLSGCSKCQANKGVIFKAD